MKEQSVRAIKCDFEGLKEMGFYGPWYTPLYEKGIRETQNKPIETTYWRVIINWPYMCVG